MTTMTMNARAEMLRKILASGLIPWDVIVFTVSVMTALGYVVYAYGWLPGCLVYVILMIGSLGQHLVARRQLRVAAEDLGIIAINGKFYKLTEITSK